MPKESHNNAGLSLKLRTEEFVFINIVNMTCKISKCEDLLCYYRKCIVSFSGGDYMEIFNPG